MFSLYHLPNVSLKQIVGLEQVRNKLKSYLLCSNKWHIIRWTLSFTFAAKIVFIIRFVGIIFVNIKNQYWRIMKETLIMFLLNPVFIYLKVTRCIRTVKLSNNKLGLNEFQHRFREVGGSVVRDMTKGHDFLRNNGSPTKVFLNSKYPP